jgi:asparagine synthase (glutamine-hydrolysing)
MCGIAGAALRDRSAIWGDSLESMGYEMASRITHRGPDESGVWADTGLGVVLGHRRLSILELTEAGAQPMVSSSGRYVLSFNGEIYNHDRLRRALDHHGWAGTWRGHSDTEALVEAIDGLGLDAALELAEGMFAFALLDRRKGELVLCRDRFGEKPLYYGHLPGGFFFASELKALMVHPGWSRERDPSVAAPMLEFGYIPAPQTIFRDVAKLRPGHMLRFDLETATVDERPYWSAVASAAEGLAQPFASREEAIAELEGSLMRSVQARMQADVPLGAFLSGGIDSSLIAALMQQSSPEPVHTYSVGFHEQGLDEAVYARDVAQTLGTHHTQMYCTGRDALEVVPDIPQLYDEPFADSSQIPTYLLSRMTRQHVTVALSGDAGDELFFGYERFFMAEPLYRAFIEWMPASIRPWLAAMMRSAPGWLAQWLHRLAGLVSARIRRMEDPQGKLRRLAEFISARDFPSFYRKMAATSADVDRLAVHPPGFNNFDEVIRAIAASGQSFSRKDFMRIADTVTYLPDDILVKVDRAAMANSLETRIPFLDRDVFRVAWQTPVEWQRDGDGGKGVLKELLYRYVPRELVDRPKQGFGVPMDAWLRNELRDWAEDLLAPEQVRASGFFDPGAVEQVWREHQRAGFDHANFLWPILVTQAWDRAWRD